jgi:CheY-like chemotaxis protein
MKNILIVDDDRDVFESMKIVLESEGYGVEWATNGREAMEKLHARKPDLMVLDVMMSTDDEGFQLAYKMKREKEFAGIPILMVTSIGAKTGFSFRKGEDEDFLPVNEFLEKPVDPRLLVDKVRENLGH